MIDDDPRRRRRHRHDGHAARHGAVAPHVAAEGLADGELEAADGAAVQLGLGERGVAVPVQPRLLVAGAVAAQRLERREHAVARLAHEHPLRRRPVATAPAGDDDRQRQRLVLAVRVRHEHQHARHLALLHCKPLHQMLALVNQLVLAGESAELLDLDWKLTRYIYLNEEEADHRAGVFIG
jgi:hypothetical protein